MIEFTDTYVAGITVFAARRAKYVAGLAISITQGRSNGCIGDGASEGIVRVVVFGGRGFVGRGHGRDDAGVSGGS